jgi:ABC-type transport system involved in cytochrome bd biosynthesis fused ATPase/permease subunit
LVVLGVLLVAPALFDASFLRLTLALTGVVAFLLLVFVSPLLFRRRVVAVHENGVRVRLPFRARFVPWAELQNVAIVDGAKGTQHAVLAFGAAHETASLPLGAIVDSVAIVEVIVRRAGLAWNVAANDGAKRAVRLVRVEELNEVGEGSGDGEDSAPPASGRGP